MTDKLPVLPRNVLYWLRVMVFVNKDATNWTAYGILSAESWYNFWKTDLLVFVPNTISCGEVVDAMNRAIELKLVESRQDVPDDKWGCGCSYRLTELGYNVVCAELLANEMLGETGRCAVDG